MKLRINFQASQKSDLEDAELIDKITVILQRENKYRVLEVANHTVVFDQNPWKLVWNFEAPNILDGGEFNISKVNGDKIVTLKYYIKILYPLIIFTILSITLALNNFYEGVPFFGLFFLITGTVQYFTTKRVGKELLINVINEWEYQ